MDCIGVMFDSIDFTMSVTPERLTEINQFVNSWLKNTKATKRKLERLIGKLLFVSGLRQAVCREIVGCVTMSAWA